ncbi:MAG: diguanylate cyclase/phosphodiesterase (GGDEF & EAL domains) with PAS/PAC sensor(s) [uncultured Thermomicrobiales bacterium]|uniref:Diguanylate cyclase/phosphodiesterase (GGDEF & EAL domains) with PAS/PAC sensor(S) n=1 Tax=uncultured Thermomicrobiales bacterium TaxID=1645740 RepID=A0A6J4V511_9BACT|nr:MAG: diguanylate cyclase/phosphodiesterase (GGDEF & EAL domains) with PAS/PAC sensor(s) [uncultured Thermomicrobiales bacterium]
MQHPYLHHGGGGQSPVTPDPLPFLATMAMPSGPVSAGGSSGDLAGAARAWFAINRERIVDGWLTAVTPHLADGVDRAFVRLRLDGYLRAITTSILSPATTPYIERVVGTGLAGLCQGSDAGLHDLRLGLAGLLTDGLPEHLRPVVGGPLERTVTQLVRGYCQKLPVPATADQPAIAAVPAADGSLLSRFIAQYPAFLTIESLDDDQLVAGNEASQRLLGYSLDELMTMDEQDLIGPETPEDDFDIGVELLSGRIPIVQRTSRMRHREGHMVTLDVRMWVLRDADGAPTHLVSEFDTPAPEADGQTHWQRADKRFRHLAQLSHDALLVVGPDGFVRYASPSTERSLGVDPDAVAGTPFADMAIPEDRGLVAAFLDRLAASPPRSTTETTVRMHRHDGLWRWFEVSGANLLDVPDFAGFSIQTRDITDRRHLEDLLGRQALLDPLTGLLNRRGLLDQVEADIARYEATGERMALLYVDLDHFKDINDRFGHETGDLVLIEMTRRLSEAIGATSEAGRLGGDEFVVLLRDSSHTGAMIAAREIHAAISRPIVHGELEIAAGACIGIALTERPGQTTSSLLHAADAALYLAKSARDGNPAMGHDRAE